MKTSGEIPSPRYGHSSVILGDSMFVFGGYDTDSFSCNDLCELDLRIEYFYSSIETLKWKTIEVKDKPPIRFHHKSLMIDNKMIVIILNC
jgi:leucine-zipper-like transcriptional regulator 1